MSLKSVVVNEVRHQVLDVGSGPPLVLVHGFPLTHGMWQGQLPLEDRFRIIAPDLRGFGGSQVVPGITTMTQMADDVAALLDALQVAEPVIFCGLSMGGYIGWQFVRRHEARLRALVLCDTKAAGDTPEAAETRRKMATHVLNFGTSAVAEAMPTKLFAAATFKEQPALIDAVRTMIEMTDPQGLAAGQQGLAVREDAQPWLDKITTPTLVVCGREDVISPVDEMQAFAAKMPHARFEVIEGAGHMAPMEKPQEFNALLTAFLDGLK